MNFEIPSQLKQLLTKKIGVPCVVLCKETISSTDVLKFMYLYKFLTFNVEIIIKRRLVCFLAVNSQTSVTFI